INRLRVGFLRETLSHKENMRDVRLIEKLNQYFDEIEYYYIRMVYPIITAITIALIITILSLYIDIKLLIILSLFLLFVLFFIIILLIITIFSLYIDIKLLIILILFSLFVLFFIPNLFKSRSTKLYDDKERTESKLYLNIYSLIYGYSDLFINKEVEEKRNRI